MPRVLVLTPTRELAAQIAESVEDYGAHKRLRTRVIFGGVGERPQIDGLRAGCDILIATPGRLLDLCEQGHCNLSQVHTLALAYFRAGDLEKAREKYGQITTLTTGRLDYGDIYATAFCRLGQIDEKRGDKAKARENYAKFLELRRNADPGFPEIDDAKTRLAGLK